METVRMYETILMHKEIEFHVQIPEGLKVMVDPDLFNCVLRNLLSNAIKYTPTTGTILLEATRNKDMIALMVRDSGTGMSDELVQLIKSDAEFNILPGLMQEKGSGLGLKICREFVQLNKGTFWFTSELGMGSSFYFTVMGKCATNMN